MKRLSDGTFESVAACACRATGTTQLTNGQHAGTHFLDMRDLSSSTPIRLYNRRLHGPRPFRFVVKENEAVSIRSELPCSDVVMFGQYTAAKVETVEGSYATVLALYGTPYVPAHLRIAMRNNASYQHPSDGKAEIRKGGYALCSQPGDPLGVTVILSARSYDQLTAYLDGVSIQTGSE